MRARSATPQAGASPDESNRGVPATHTAWVLAQRSGQLLVVALALVAAFAIDWLLVPRSYPVAAAYGVSLILAALLMASPVIVAELGVLALALSITSNLLQAAPVGALVGNNAGLLAIGLMAVLLARQRKITRDRKRKCAVI